MQLDGAFRAFAAAVNALPGNASTPLSVIRSLADATANRWGYTWQLGHPVDPHLWFLTESTTAQDTTPGKEFICWALKTHGGNDELHRDSCHALYKSPGTTGWCSIAVFPRTSKQFYG